LTNFFTQANAPLLKEQVLRLPSKLLPQAHATSTHPVTSHDEFVSKQETAAALPTIANTETPPEGKAGEKVESKQKSGSAEIMTKNERPGKAERLTAKEKNAKSEETTVEISTKGAQESTQKQERSKGNPSRVIGKNEKVNKVNDRAADKQAEATIESERSEKASQIEVARLIKKHANDEEVRTKREKHAKEIEEKDPTKENQKKRQKVADDSANRESRPVSVITIYP